MTDNYKVLDLSTYYRKGVYEHFTKDCKSSVSITAKVDVTALKRKSKDTATKFYINFVYCLAKALNTRDDYKMVYRWKTDEILVYDRVNVTHYVFDENSETCTPAYTEYDENYDVFYRNMLSDLETAKAIGGYNLDMANHPNYFDASYLPWISYDALHVELPDGHIWLQPIVNWGKYVEDDGKLLLPLTIRLNHAIADGYLVSKVILTLNDVIAEFCKA